MKLLRSETGFVFMKRIVNNYYCLSLIHFINNLNISKMGKIKQLGIWMDHSIAIFNGCNK